LRRIGSAPGGQHGHTLQLNEPMASRKAYLLRIDPALWNELEAWAQDELRSVNGQIEYLLKQAVAKRKGHHPEISAETPDATAEE